MCMDIFHKGVILNREKFNLSTLNSFPGQDFV